LIIADPPYTLPRARLCDCELLTAPAKKEVGYFSAMPADGMSPLAPRKFRHFPLEAATF